MDLPVAQELRVFEARNQAQNPLLFGETKMILKADQVVAVGAQILLAQLHGGVRTPARARIDQAHRLHRTEAQRIAAAPRDLLDRQAGFEVRHVVRNVRFGRFRRDQVHPQSARIPAFENGQFR